MKEGLIKMNKFKDLRIRSGMNMAEFSRYFNIPYRTIQNWELRDSKTSKYILDLLEYKLKHEGKIR